jgi:hypothetical protein
MHDVSVTWHPALLFSKQNYDMEFGVYPLSVYFGCVLNSWCLIVMDVRTLPNFTHPKVCTSTHLIASPAPETSHHHHHGPRRRHSSVSAIEREKQKQVRAFFTKKPAGAAEADDGGGRDVAHRPLQRVVAVLAVVHPDHHHRLPLLCRRCGRSTSLGLRHELDRINKIKQECFNPLL